MAKSTRLVTTAAMGITRRGKYTLVIRCWLPTRLLLGCVSAWRTTARGAGRRGEQRRRDAVGGEPVARRTGREDDTSGRRLDDGPGDAEGGLLVADPDVARRRGSRAARGSARARGGRSAASRPWGGSAPAPAAVPGPGPSGRGWRGRRSRSASVGPPEYPRAAAPRPPRRPTAGRIGRFRLVVRRPRPGQPLHRRRHQASRCADPQGHLPDVRAAGSPKGPDAGCIAGQIDRRKILPRWRCGERSTGDRGARGHHPEPVRIPGGRQPVRETRCRHRTDGLGAAGSSAAARDGRPGPKGTTPRTMRAQTRFGSGIGRTPACSSGPFVMRPVPQSRPVASQRIRTWVWYIGNCTASRHAAAFSRFHRSNDSTAARANDG